MRIILADPKGELIEAWEKIGAGGESVRVYPGSIFDVECEALVSPANRFGFMDGELDLKISNFFGWHVQERLQEKIRTRNHGELLVGTAEIVETDHSEIPFVISAPTMRVPMILRDSVNVYLAIRALLLLVKYGRFDDGTPIGDKVQTIAMPGMGTGAGQVPPSIFARQMGQAVEDVLEEKSEFPTSWLEAHRTHRSLFDDSVDN